MPNTPPSGPGFALQEFVYGTPVVDQSPLFFTFFGDLLAPGSTASLGLSSY